jgi:hypothetical protein
VTASAPQPLAQAPRQEWAHNTLQMTGQSRKDIKTWIKPPIVSFFFKASDLGWLLIAMMSSSLFSSGKQKRSGSERRWKELFLKDFSYY